MVKAMLHFENIRSRIIRGRDLTEARDLLAELLSMPDSRLFSTFGIVRWTPQDVHSLKDQIFMELSTKMIQNGWNCNAASFGPGRRDTFLMEMARRGLAQTVNRLLEMGAEPDFNSQGYGDSTALMAARDPEIMKKLLYYGANPLAVNAMGQTDFTYKLLKGLTIGARFYLYNTEKIPFQALLNNFKDCVLNHMAVPYDPMYPLCLVPIVPRGVPYENIVDQALVDAMLEQQCCPFSSKALSFPLEGGRTVWQHIRFRMRSAPTVVPALLLAYMACMAKLDECRTSTDFNCVETYLDKPLPREIVPRGVFSKAMFVYMLFSLSMLPTSKLLRWLVLIDKVIHRTALWMDILGEEPFRVTNSLLPSDRKGSHVLNELTSMQALLVMRVNVTDSFGEFRIPDELTTLLASGSTPGVLE